MFVKVRETYDLHTTKNKMTVIGIHTPKPDIIKRNYPGLLMQCKAYRPVSADVRIACASVLPLDPQGVGLAEGDVAPEDIFNPILYKAMSNKGMSQLEAKINYMCHNPANPTVDVDGSSAAVDVDNLTSGLPDEFGVYYALLANMHDWKHANPQSGLQMKSLKPLVYEMVYNVGDQDVSAAGLAKPDEYAAAGALGQRITGTVRGILGKAKQMPFINCTSYSYDSSDAGSYAAPGFPVADVGASNASVEVPWINVVCGAIIVPPSRLHELFYRMIVEWTIEFSQIRSLSDLVTWGGVSALGNAEYHRNYDYSEAKKAITGTDETILDNDSCMVSANVEINKVM